LGSIFTAGFDSGQNLLDRGPLALVRADADPGDSPITVDHKSRTPRKIECVDTYRLVNAVRPRHLPGFVEKNRKRVGALFDVFPSTEEAVDFLRRNKCNSRVALFEFIVSRLELSQLIGAVRSPRAADEDENQRLSMIVRETHRLAIGGWEFELGCSVAHLESRRFVFKHRPRASVQSRYNSSLHPFYESQP
jgi:hypothetical protein